MTQFLSNQSMNDLPPQSADPPLPVALRDALDRQLLALLQANARESAANLARKLGMARTEVRCESGTHLARQICA